MELLPAQATFHSCLPPRPTSHRGPPPTAHRSLPTAHSFPNDLHQHPLLPSSIEFPVENLFPRAEVEFAFGDGQVSGQ